MTTLTQYATEKDIIEAFSSEMEVFISAIGGEYVDIDHVQAADEQLKTSKKITSVLENISPSVLLEARSKQVLDYVPWIRRMVEVDDEMEEASNAEMLTRATYGKGRTTRNSQRQSYVRWVELNGYERVILRDTAFRVEDTFRGEKTREQDKG